MPEYKSEKYTNQSRSKLRRYLLAGALGASMVVLGACGSDDAVADDETPDIEQVEDADKTDADVDSSGEDKADDVTYDTPDEVLSVFLKAVHDGDSKKAYNMSYQTEDDIQEIEELGLTEQELDGMIALNMLMLEPLKDKTVENFDKDDSEESDGIVYYSYEGEGDDEGLTISLTVEKHDDTWYVDNIGMRSNITFDEAEFEPAEGVDIEFIPSEGEEDSENED